MGSVDTRQATDVVIVAAGKGTRLGATVPKAFVPLAGTPLFVHSLKVFTAHSAIRSVFVVVADEMKSRARELMLQADIAGEPTLVSGGAERWNSVHNGVAASDAEWVLVHDAARPFVTDAVIDSLLAKRSAYRCAVTATPLVDTIRSFRGDRCTGTIDRSTLVRVGTPQLFHRPTLVEAFERAEELHEPPTDEAVLMEHAGASVGLAWGDPLNFKVTTPEDQRIAEALLAEKNQNQM